MTNKYLKLKYDLRKLNPMQQNLPFIKVYQWHRRKAEKFFSKFKMKEQRNENEGGKKVEDKYMGHVRQMQN